MRKIIQKENTCRELKFNNDEKVRSTTKNSNEIDIEIGLMNFIYNL